MSALSLRLPSGRPVVVRRVGESAPVDDDVFAGDRFFSARVYRAVETGELVVEDRERGAALETSDLDGLPLPDYHALRDAAIRVGAVAEDAPPQYCRNCDEALPPAPEQAPTEDLEHWYGDAEPPDPTPWPLSAAGPELVLRTTTAGEARAFHRAALADSFAASAEVASAMGIVSLGGERTPAKIAQALDALDDDAWAVLEAAYEHFAYSSRSYFPVVCPSCGALHDMPAPAAREVYSGPLPDPSVSPFVDYDTFAEITLTIGEEVYREMGVDNIELEVVHGEADVDDSGEPLLGSYQPRGPTDAAGVAIEPFLIRVYYRTFERMYEDEPYDVSNEIRETIAHEVQHHLHYLEGHDPMDLEERQEAQAELERTYGERAVKRAKVAVAVSEASNLGVLALGSVGLLALIVLFLYLTGRL